jgi:hypothetical protein
MQAEANRTTQIRNVVASDALEAASISNTPEMPTDDPIRWLLTVSGRGWVLIQPLRRNVMQFALLIYHSPEEFAMRKNDYNDPHLGAWRAYYKALVEAGVYVGADALEVPETGTTVRVKEGKRRVQDGPYADTKEQLAGFIILELPSVDAALEWAARCPGASIGAVEVRPLAPEAKRRGFTG